VGRKNVPQRVHRDDLIEAAASAALRQMVTIVFVVQDSEIKNTFQLHGPAEKITASGRERASAARTLHL
jgi:hypothetical protein